MCKRGHTGGRYKNGGCIECQNARSNAYRAAHREEIKARNEAWRAAHVEERKAYYAAHREEIKARSIAYYAAHRVEQLYTHLMRRAKGAPCATLEEIKKLDPTHDGLTGIPLPDGVRPHLDHIIPRSKGGMHTIENLRWVHPMTNHAKNNHSDEEFLEWWHSRGK